MIPRFAVFFNLTLKELTREVELAKRRSNLGAFYRVECYKYIVDWQKRKDRDKPAEPYPEGKVRIRNRRRYEHLRGIGVISERPNPQAPEIEYIVTLKGLEQAVEVLSFLGTTVHFIIQNRVQGSAGSTAGSLRAGCPVKDVTFEFPPFAYNYHYPDVGVRMRGRIKLRREIWHEIMELTILAINCKVFNDPGDTSSTLVGESWKTFAHWTTQALLNNIGDDHFYPWEVDDEDKTDVYDAWAHQAMAWEEEAERLEGVALMLENQGSYIRANSVWAECANAWEKAARAWDASNFPEARERAKEARNEMEAALKRAGHWEVVGSPGKKVTIKYENWFGDFKATILDYANRWVDSLSVSSARNGKIDWGEKADPGLYKIEAGDGVKKEFKILPKKSLVLEAKFVRDSFGSLYLSKEYKNWPAGKRIGIRIIGPSGSELHSKETERTDGKLEWGKNHDFKPGEYTITAFVNQQCGDPFLKELLQKGQLVAPKKIKAPAWNVSSAGRHIVITYKNWIDRFRGEILDTSGKKMETFDKSSGDGKIEWGDNSKVEAGVYFVKVKLGSNKYEVKKAIILK